MTVQPGLCQTWSEPQIVGFLMHRLKWLQIGCWTIVLDRVLRCVKCIYCSNIINAVGLSEIIVIKIANARKLKNFSFNVVQK